MKKTLITFLFLFSLFFIQKDIFAAEEKGFTGTGFYSSIANSIGSIESSLYTIDLPGEVGTKEKLNGMIGENCISDNLSVEEIKTVAIEGKINIIIKKISSECKDEDSIPLPKLNNILNAVKKLHDDTYKTAERKTEQLMVLGSTGIYADGVAGNAPFDIIVDLKKIDSIIFEEASESYESDEYDGTNNFDLGEKLSNMSQQALQINSSGNNSGRNSNWNNNYVYNDLRGYFEYNSNTLENKYQCSIYNSSNSGLDDGSINYILNQNHNYTTGTKPIYFSGGSYSKVNDNAVFPCTEFFCIQVNYGDHEYDSYGKAGKGGTKGSSSSSKSGDGTLSIEGILKRSNEHLKKFANSKGTMAASKMTINNFELGFMDLDLTEMPSFPIQVISKPVPFLNVTHNEGVNKSDNNKKDSDGKEDSSDKGKSDKDRGTFEFRNQLRFYYDTYNMEYDRQNDLSILRNIAPERQAVLNSAMITPKNAGEKMKEFDEYEKQKLEQRKEMEKLIQNEIKIGILEDMELQFKELEVFNKSIKDYVINLSALIDRLLEIPVDSGQN